jgi:hypothetical protein
MRWTLTASLFRRDDRSRSVVAACSAGGASQGRGYDGPEKEMGVA